MKEYIILSILLLLNIKHGNCLEKFVPHIAIIGGGIGGASTSHFLTELFDENLKIDLYEGKIIGGRLATVEIDNNKIEAGGAIIHPRNIYMQRFVKLLGLEHKSPDDIKYGIWNGDEFVFKEDGWYIMSMIKMFYRYGFQMFKFQRYINTMLDDFAKIYELQDAGKFFPNVTSLLSAMNKEFPRLLQISIRDHLIQLGFAERLINELIQTTIVVNYGQDINVHSFVGSVSVAGAGADLWSVKGGNKKVPEHLIYRNKNINVIPRSVTKIRYIVDENDLNQYEVTYTNKDSTNLMTSNYDIVIVAAPLTHDQEFPIEFAEFPKKLEFPGNYHTTYATFVKADLNPKYFGLQETLGAILSCNPNKTKINSISEVNPVDETEKNSRIWKIFSKESVETDVMRNMLSHIAEKKEIAWKAYPHYSTNEQPNNFKLHDALYHVNAIEWAASAMEMSAIAGRNVAILAYNDFLQKLNFVQNTDVPENLHEKLHSGAEL